MGPNSAVTTCNTSTCESSADAAARLPAGQYAPPAPPRYDICHQLGLAWDRIVGHLRANPDELRRRLARRRLPALTRPPRPWCLCIRAADTRINSFTAACAPSDAAYPRSHLGPNVIRDPQPHDVQVDKPLLRKLCMPVHLPRGYNEVTEVADWVGTSHTHIRDLMRRGHFAVKRIPRLGGRWGHPVPLISVPWPLDPSAANLQPPDPLWDHHWPILVSYVPDDFEQLLIRVPSFRKSNGGFLGWQWRCPGCNKPADRLFYPLPAAEMVLLRVDGVERDEVDDLPRYCQTFACQRCHNPWRFSRLSPCSWNNYICSVSGGLLYGHEVPRPPDYHLAPPRREIDPPAIDPERLAPRISARKKRFSPHRRQAPRAQAIIPLLLQNLGRRAIAKEFGISHQTVYKSIQRLCRRHRRKNLHTLFPLLRKKYPHLAQSAPDHYNPTRGPQANPRPPRKRLAVLRLMLSGKPFPQIAAALNLTYKAVAMHAVYLYKQFHVHSRRELLSLPLFQRIAEERVRPKIRGVDSPPWGRFSTCPLHAVSRRLRAGCKPAPRASKPSVPKKWTHSEERPE